jgi:hypothetical protein
MANNPKKVKDPTEVALSAIQEALNISDVSSDSSRSASRSDALPIAPPPPPPQNLDEPMFSQRPGTDFDPRPSSDMSVFEPIEEPRATMIARPSGRSCRRFRRAARHATSTRSPRCLPASG